MCEPAPARVASARCSAAWPLAVAMRRDAAFERGDALLEHRVGRIGDARIDVRRARSMLNSAAAWSASRKTKEVVW